MQKSVPLLLLFFMVTTGFLSADETTLETENSEYLKALNKFLTESVDKVIPTIPELTETQMDPFVQETAKLFLAQALVTAKIQALRHEGDRKAVKALRDEFIRVRKNAFKNIEKILTKKQFKAFKKTMDELTPTARNDRMIRPSMRKMGAGGTGNGRQGGGE